MKRCNPIRGGRQLGEEISLVGIPRPAQEGPAREFLPSKIVNAVAHSTSDSPAAGDILGKLGACIAANWNNLLSLLLNL